MSHRIEIDEYMNDTLEDMIRDIGVDSFKKAHVGDTLKSDMEESLFMRCKFFTRLSVVLRLFILKTKGGWMNRSFSELLELLQEILLEGKTLLKRSYEAKKILCPMDIDYVKIHACDNDFKLYRKTYENLKKFPKCGESHYMLNDYGVEDDDGVTRNGAHAKVMWCLYLSTSGLVVTLV